MENPKTYTDREIDALHRSIDEKLTRIERQTRLTNGRVGTLERWMYTVIGAIVVLSFLMANNMLSFFS